MRISVTLIFLWFFNFFVVNAQPHHLAVEHTLHYRIEVEVNPGVDADLARQAFMMKPEIHIVSWNTQSGIIDLRTVAQVTPDVLKTGLAEFQIKVKSIQILTH